MRNTSSAISRARTRLRATRRMLEADGCCEGDVDDDDGDDDDEEDEEDDVDDVGCETADAVLRPVPRFDCFSTTRGKEDVEDAATGAPVPAPTVIAVTPVTLMVRFLIPQPYLTTFERG